MKILEEEATGGTNLPSLFLSEIRHGTLTSIIAIVVAGLGVAGLVAYPPAHVSSFGAVGWLSHLAVLGFILSGCVGLAILALAFHVWRLSVRKEKLRQAGDEMGAEVLRILDGPNARRMTSLVRLQIRVFIPALVLAGPVAIIMM